MPQSHWLRAVRLEGWLLVVHEPRPGFFPVMPRSVPDAGVALMAGLNEEHDSGGCEFQVAPASAVT